MLLVDVDHDLLDRLQNLALVAAAEQDLRPRDAEFEAFAPHGFDQDRELQFASPRDHVGVGIGGLLDLERDITLCLLKQTVADHAARHLVALGPRERTVVDGKGHRQRRRVDRLGGQRLDLFRGCIGCRRR